MYVPHGRARYFADIPTGYSPDTLRLILPDSRQDIRSDILPNIPETFGPFHPSRSFECRRHPLHAPQRLSYTAIAATTHRTNAAGL